MSKLRNWLAGMLYRAAERIGAAQHPPTPGTALFVSDADVVRAFATIAGYGDYAMLKSDHGPPQETDEGKDG
jgi:hypothetical protein